MTVLAVLLLSPLFFLRAWALAAEDDPEALFGLDALSRTLTDEERAVSGVWNGVGSYNAQSALHRLSERFLQTLAEQLRENVSFALSLATLAVLGGFAVSLCEEERIRNVLELCVCCAAAAVLLDGMDGLIGQTRAAIFRLADYAKTALPVVFTAAAASGAVSSAPARFAAISFALDAMLELTQRLVLPLINAHLATVLANALFPNSVLNAAAKLTRWAANTAMTGASLAFTVYISLTGAIGAAVDAAAVKAARTVISSTLPLVGGMISDVSASVLSAAGVVRSCAGAFGLIAVCTLCLGSFVTLSLRTLLFKAVATLTEGLPGSRLQALLSGIGSASAMLMGLLGACSLMLFLSFTAGMKAVSG